MAGPDRFLCDEMLAGLGKWLRAAGYDTVIAAAGSPDRQLLATAIREDRLLISRDRSFLQRKGSSGVVLLLEQNGLDNLIAELSDRLAIDWLHAPLSRCLSCNTPLKAGPGPFGTQLPGYVAAEGVASFHCPACRKAFWNGGHATRMRLKLEKWNGG